MSAKKRSAVQKPVSDLKLLEEVDESFLKMVSKLKLEEKALSVQQTNDLIPLSLDLIGNPNMKARANGMVIIAGQLRCANPEMRIYCEALCKRLGDAEVLNFKKDDDDEDSYITYQRDLISAISSLQASYPEVIVRHFKPIARHLVDCVSNENIHIKLAGCEYWGRLNVPPVPKVNMDLWITAVQGRVRQFIPKLINCLVYHDDHAAFLEHHGSTSAENPCNNPMPDNITCHSDIRNYSALALETMSRLFPAEVTLSFRPILEKWIDSEDWKEIEAIILALSAYTAAVGLPASMREVYPAIVPKILDYFSHTKPLVRSIACFAMPHFFNYDIKGMKDPFSKVFQKTIPMLRDNCPEVQSIAIRSLTNMIAFSKNDISPYIRKIIDSLVEMNNVITGESRFIYYECIGHLIARAGSMIDADDVEFLVKPLLQEWKELQLNSNQSSNQLDMDIVRLSQSLCITASYSKSTFAPFCPTIYEKSCGMIQEILRSRKGSGGKGEPASSPEESASDAIISQMVAYLDLLSATFDGQRGGVLGLAIEHHVLRYLEFILHDQFFVHCHQSALALLGHIAQHAKEPVEPKLENFLEIISSILLGEKNDDVKNNALWALVFISKSSFVQKEKLFELVNILIQIFEKTDGHSGCIINAALALTNICAASPKQTFGVMVREDVFLHLCGLLQSKFPVDRDKEKIEIFKNICTSLSPALIKVEPDLWIQFLIAIAASTTSDDELQETLQVFLHNLRAELGIVWNRLMTSIGSQLSYTLRKRYKLY